MTVLRPYPVSVDLALRCVDLDDARDAFDFYLRELGLDAAAGQQARAYDKGEVNSRVTGRVTIDARDFAAVIARMRRLDAAIFNRRSPYLRILDGEHASVSIVGPSPDDPIDDPEIVWVDIEVEDQPI